MNEPLCKYMQVGLVHFMAYPETINGDGPVYETVRKIAIDDFFNAIEITWIKDVTIREKVRKILSDSHMTVAYGAQPRLLTERLNINDLDEKSRMKAVASLKDGIDEACEMGASGFSFLSGKYEESIKEDAYKALVMSVKELCEYAKTKGNTKGIN
ncbi:MAG: TIM barrel protein [Ruminiclostridium sp.]|nr:TIM barrel protein [Ruminiclostridium sp.]